MTFHWRGAPDEEAAHARVEELAAEAEGAGLSIHWGARCSRSARPSLSTRAWRCGS